MKKFSFSLHRLVDICSARMLAAEQALSNALKEEAEAEFVLRALKEQRAQVVREVEKIHGRVQRSEWSEKIRYLQDYDRRICIWRDELRKSSEKVEQCRKTLNEEMTQQRVLEKLEKSERCRWRETMRVAEQKQMDEVAASRWVRQEERI